MTIINVGTDELMYAVPPIPATWLTLSGDLKGVLSPWDSVSVELNFDISDLEVGTYHDTVTVLSNNPFNPSISIPVSIDLYSSGLIRVPSNFNTIQQAISHAYDGAEVLVADGTYIGDGNRDIDFEGKAITVTSVNGPETTIIDCFEEERYYHRGFYFYNDEGVDSKLSGFTIRNGKEGIGGGIYVEGASPSISNCIILENQATNGGGLFIINSYSQIKNCIIEDNISFDDGGGIQCSHSYPVIKNCIIIGNIAQGRGGGIWSYSTLLSLTNCTISGNSTHEYGGGLYA